MTVNDEILSCQQATYVKLGVPSWAGLKRRWNRRRKAHLVATVLYVFVGIIRLTAAAEWITMLLSFLPRPRLMRHGLGREGDEVERGPQGLSDCLTSFGGRMAWIPVPDWNFGTF